MTASIYITAAGTALVSQEIALLERMAHKHGHVTLLVSSYAEGEVCRASLADAGLGLAVDVLTIPAWVEGLWRLLGNGTHIVSSGERLLLIAQVLGNMISQDAAALEPLKDNPGTARMIAEMAQACLPFVQNKNANATSFSPAERKALSVLKAYSYVLDEHDLCEASAAAMQLASFFDGELPQLARAVVVRGIGNYPEHVLCLLEAIAKLGELTLLLNHQQKPLAQELEERFAATAKELAQGEGAVQGGEPSPSSGDALATALSENARVVDPACFEVCGPAARDAAYTSLIHDLIELSKQRANAGATAIQSQLAIAAPKPLELFDHLAPRLAAQGLSVSVKAPLVFAQTRAGQTFFQLIDFLNRLNNREASAWWPAPDLADFLRSPFTGLGVSGAFEATSFDKLLRKTRTMDKTRLFAELDSRQSRAQNHERKRAQERGREPRSIVFKQVVDALDAGKYARALQLMGEACAQASTSAFGAGGFAEQQLECSALQRAYDLLEAGRCLGVNPERSLVALQALKVSAAFTMTPGTCVDASLDGSVACAQAEQYSAKNLKDSSTQLACAQMPHVQIVTLGSLAAHKEASFDAVFLADADAESYQLAQRDTVSTLLAQKLDCEGLCLAPAPHQRDLFTRALAAARYASCLAYVGHDASANERYAALSFTELDAASSKNACNAFTALPGEDQLFANLDSAGAMGVNVDNAPRLPEHVLARELHPYLLLHQRCSNGVPQTRTLSASQVENYLACPYRWFVNSRITSHRLDVEFGPIERGNFAHDVMQRFYERLAEQDIARVTPQNIEPCLEQMDLAFDEVREDHQRGKYTHGKYANEERPRTVRGGLVPLDELDKTTLEHMRAQFHEVVRNDANMLSIYTPSMFEYSFDKEGVEYAGRPLGGRIDRVDVAPDAGRGQRVVVIDYKTSSVDSMKCEDPTLKLNEGDKLAEDWLPGRDTDRAPKVQTLMYATALERALNGSAQGAVYYGLRKQEVAGAVSDALTECEPPAFPHKKVSPFPGLAKKKGNRDGEMQFPELLERIERSIEHELDALEAGAIAPRPASDSCKYCPLTMCEKRR